MPIDIRPTLFIGLGSSGVNIIKEFRRLMFEQFTVAGLPTIAYVGLETDAAYDIKDDLLPNSFSLEDWENIHLLRTIILSTQGIDPIKGPELDKWLDKAVLNVAGALIQNGAGSIRMLGRLALWKHAGTVAQELLKKHGFIVSPSARAGTLTLLNTKAGGLFANSTVNASYDVYLLGTLCGGTCGGMFIDMAYLVQRLFNLSGVFWPGGMTPVTPAIYGIFTIPDSDMANLPTTSKRFANSWASLLELDHYMDSAYAQYDYNLPDTARKDPATSPPFSAVQLVSRTNLLKLAFSCPRLADFDGAALNKMVALKIFNDMFSGLNNQIAAAMVDGTAGNVPGLGSARRNRFQRTKTILSFGVSALWNPRYQFAEAFACTQGQQFCRNLATELNTARGTMLKGRAQSEWARLRSNGLAIMMGVPGGQNIQTEMDKAFESAKGHLGTKGLAGLANILGTYPAANPLGRRFEQNGDLWNIMSAQVHNMRTHFVQGVQTLLDTEITRINPAGGDGNGIVSLAEMKEFMGYLSETIQADMADCPVAPPAWQYKPLTFPANTASLSESGWLKMLNRAGLGIPAAKNKIFGNWKDQVEMFMKRTRQYFVRPVLEDLVNRVIPTYRTKIGNAIDNLRNAENLLRQTYDIVEKAAEVQSENIIKVSEHPTLQAHVSDLSGRFLRDGAQLDVMNDILDQWGRTDNNATGNWLDLFTLDSEQLAELIRFSHSRWALGVSTDNFDLANEALARFGAVNDLANLAKRSFPFVMLRAGTNLTQWARNPNYICGAGNNMGLLDSHLQGKDAILNFATFQSPLQNMVVFSQLLPHIYADDLFVSQDMKACYESLLKQNLHTHVRQEKEFDKEYAKRKKSATEKLWAIQALYPNEVFEPVKRGNGRGYAFRAKMADGRPIPPIDVTEVDGQDKLCSLMATDSPEGQAVKQKFDQDVKTLLEKKTKDVVFETMSSLQSQWENERLEEKITDTELEERNRKVNKLVDAIFGRSN